MLIPFSRLYLSDANVRKTRSEEDDIQLSADIEARGLLQNLLVTKSKKRGKFAVIAGGRRLRAIEMIVTRGAWAPDTEIECKLLEGSEEEAGEASLAENFQRVGMSPAEECRAFQHFIKEGSDVAAVAKRFTASAITPHRNSWRASMCWKPTGSMSASARNGLASRVWPGATRSGNRLAR